MRQHTNDQDLHRLRLQLESHHESFRTGDWYVLDAIEYPLICTILHGLDLVIDIVERDCRETDKGEEDADWLLEHREAIAQALEDFETREDIQGKNSVFNRLASGELPKGRLEPIHTSVPSSGKRLVERDEPRRMVATHTQRTGKVVVPGLGKWEMAS